MPQVRLLKWMEVLTFKGYKKIHVMSGTNIKRRKGYYNLLVALSLLVVILSFSPMLLVKNKINPTFLNMPFALWTNILATILLVFFTFIGGRLRGDKGDFSSDN